MHEPEPKGRRLFSAPLRNIDRESPGLPASRGVKARLAFSFHTQVARGQARALSTIQNLRISLLNRAAWS